MIELTKYTKDYKDGKITWKGRKNKWLIYIKV